jgi:hypothetical protein
VAAGAGQVAQLGRRQHCSSRVTGTAGVAGDEHTGPDGRTGFGGERGGEDTDERRHVAARAEHYGGPAAEEIDEQRGTGRRRGPRSGSGVCGGAGGEVDVADEHRGDADHTDEQQRRCGFAQ